MVADQQVRKLVKNEKTLSLTAIDEMPSSSNQQGHRKNVDNLMAEFAAQELERDFGGFFSRRGEVGGGVA